MLKRFSDECLDLLDSIGSPQKTPSKPEFPAVTYVHLANVRNSDWSIEETRILGNGSVKSRKIPPERQLRLVEADYSALLQASSTLEDIVCNIAIELSLSGLAWQGCHLDEHLKDPQKPMARRGNARRFLRAAYVAGGHKDEPLRWLSKHRNGFTHAHYPSAMAVLKARLIVVTHETPGLDQCDHRREETLTSQKLINNVQQLHGHFYPWFLHETEQQLP
ncbi:MAG TPA: hypothetical protein VGL56_15455 [Fimbriimonadaceae bacterium]|jgi:hypothetical protein